MSWQLTADRPIYLQLIEEIELRIVSGMYTVGEKLPGVRDLAAQASVNPNTMQKALTELERQGLVYSQRTAGRFITEDSKMIQLIVSDLDGTLLNSDQQITKRTIRAIKQLQKKGVRLLINTEMNYFDTQQILETYDLQCDIACFGGSCIFDSYGKQLHASYIPSERIPEMLRIFGSCRTFYEIHSANGLCILGSKTGYKNYLKNEVIPSIKKEFPSLKIESDTCIQNCLLYTSDAADEL